MTLNVAGGLRHSNGGVSAKPSKDVYRFPLISHRLAKTFNIMSFLFQLDYWEDGEWFVGCLPQVPGVFSQGKTLEELEANIREAYQLMLEEQAGTVTIQPTQYEAKLAALRTAIDEGEASGIAEGDVFARVRQELARYKTLL